ncbi:MAG: hypothetical protein ACLQM6_01935 [Acidobacteriaceae bacterium]
MRKREIAVMPTWEQLQRTRTLFQEYEPGDLFYRAAKELVALALDGKTHLSVAESLAALLQTWNAKYYKLHPFDTEHFKALENLLSSRRSTIDAFRSRSIASMAAHEAQIVADLFTSFELVLGPVGAAKALHLLAPEFFPLWDRDITKAYRINLGAPGTNAAEFVRFMTIVVKQVAQLVSNGPCDGLLKRLDEYNYSRFTRGWSWSGRQVNYGT